MSRRTSTTAGLAVRHRIVTVDGREREWVEVTSTTERAADRRLLVAVHGSGQSPGSLRSLSGYTFDDWARAGHVVAYPRSWRRGLWNDARASTPSRARADGVDDIAFLESLVRHYRDSDAGGVSRAYGIGYSNGGQLLIRVVLETHLLSAAGLVGATMPAENNLLAAIDPEVGAIPMLLVHGTSDSIVPFAGGTARALGRARGMMRSFDDSVAFWVDRAGIAVPPDIDEMVPVGPRRGGARRLAFTEPGHPSVIAYAMTGGGHLIPNRREAGMFLMGTRNHSIDTMSEFTRLVEDS